MTVNFTNSYQTVPLPNGGLIQGMFPTIEWFKTIHEYVDFKDKVMIDIGCCEFSYGIQALNVGAKHIIGIDSDQLRIDQSQHVIAANGFTGQTTLSLSMAEDYVPPAHDIMLFSMVIHWMQEPEFHIKRLTAESDTVVFVYRVMGFPNDTGYLPELDQLDALMGRPHLAHEVISNTPEQNIRLTIYKLK